MSFVVALIVVAISGFLSLSYEILWYREFAFASGGAPWVFGRVLAAFLIGLAEGSIVSSRVAAAARDADQASQFRVVCIAIIGASIGAYLVVPGMSWLAIHRVWQAAFVLVVGAAFLMGLVLPLNGIAPGDKVPLHGPAPESAMLRFVAVLPCPAQYVAPPLITAPT